MRAAVLAMVAVTSCSVGSECQLDAQCATGLRCLADGATGTRKCAPPCEYDDQCTGEGEVCVTGECIRVDVKVRLIEPSGEAHSAATTWGTVRVRGTVAFFGPNVRMSVTARQDATEASCFQGTWEMGKVFVVENAKAASSNDPFAVFSGPVEFDVDDVVAPPGTSELVVEASSSEAVDSLSVALSAPECTGCGGVRIDGPLSGSNLGGTVMRLDGLTGTVDGMEPCAAWSVTSTEGEVMDGVARLADRRVSDLRVPLFPGFNRVRLSSPGSTTAYCEISVATEADRDVPLRTSLTWDRPANLDLHIVLPDGTPIIPGVGGWGPDCHWANCVTGLNDFAGGRAWLDVDDDDGYGPESAFLSGINDGTYGVVIYARSGDAVVRLRNFSGGSEIAGVSGCFVPAERRYVAGLIHVVEGVATFEPINKLVDGTIGTPPPRWLDATDPFGMGVTAVDCPLSSEEVCR